MRLPTPGLVPHDHVADEHRLESLTHALSRQLPCKPPGQPDIEACNFLEALPVLGDPTQVAGLQARGQECRCLPAVPQDGLSAPEAVREGAPSTKPPRSLLVLVLLLLLPLLLQLLLLMLLLLLLPLLRRLPHLLLQGRLRQLCKQALEAEKGPVLGGVIPDSPENVLAPSCPHKLACRPALAKATCQGSAKGLGNTMCMNSRIWPKRDPR